MSLTIKFKKKKFLQMVFIIITLETGPAFLME